MVETNLKAIELKDLWRRYKQDGDRRARERLVLAYSPLVKYVAGRMSTGLPSHVEEADLISYGLLGLISAIGAYGGFVIPQVLNASNTASGSYTPAFYGFVGAYVLMLAVCWFFYIRNANRNAMGHV